MGRFDVLIPALGALVTVLFFLRSRARRHSRREDGHPDRSRSDAVEALVSVIERGHRLAAVATGVLLLVVVAIVALTNEIAAWIMGSTLAVVVVLYVLLGAGGKDPAPHRDDASIGPR